MEKKKRKMRIVNCQLLIVNGIMEKRKRNPINFFLPAQLLALY